MVGLARRRGSQVRGGAVCGIRVALSAGPRHQEAAKVMAGMGSRILPHILPSRSRAVVQAEPSSVLLCWWRLAAGQPYTTASTITTMITAPPHRDPFVLKKLHGHLLCRSRNRHVHDNRQTMPAEKKDPATRTGPVYSAAGLTSQPQARDASGWRPPLDGLSGGLAQADGRPVAAPPSSVHRRPVRSPSSPISRPPSSTG